MATKGTSQAGSIEIMASGSPRRKLNLDPRASRPPAEGSTTATPGRHRISVRGKAVAVPSIQFDAVQVIAQGRLVRVASIHDEEWLEASQLPDVAGLVAAVASSRLKADLLTFTQRIPDTAPKHSLPMRWDNSAVIRVSTYQQWWESLSQDSRRNIRLAEKKGVTVRKVAFDDELVRGIHSIYNEAAVRLGKRFWHFGKDLETVRRENSTYLERSEFIGAFLEGKLIGFIKLVHVDNCACIMQILAMIAHQDKRTTNALIAKAVETCAAGGRSFLRYLRYVYGRNEESLLTEFKRRNGFVKMEFPRYYVPLTLRGRLALLLRAQDGLKGMLPLPLLKLAFRLRGFYFSRQRGRSGGQPGPRTI
jgi:hypothetical protein